MYAVRFRAIALILLAALALAAVPRPAGAVSGRVALLVANAAYPDSDVTLPTPAADARALGDELKRRGFAVEVAENLGKEAMQAAIAGFARKIEPRTIAFVFFAGYGIQVGKQNYMIPVDARIWSEADVLRDGLAVDGLLDDLGKRGADTRVLVLDASRRNPFERRFRSFSTGLAPARALPGTLALHAAAAGSVLNETNATRSLFVTELVKQIALPGQGAEQAFGAVRDALARATRNQQVPALASGLQEAFSFDPDWSPAGAGAAWIEPVRPPAKSEARLEPKSEFKSDPKPADPRPAERPQTRPGPEARPAEVAKAEPPVLVAPREPAREPDGPSRADEEAIQAYNAANRVGTREAFEAFLREHPGSSLATRARAEIDRIRTIEAAQEAARKEAARNEAAKEAARETAPREAEAPPPPPPYSAAERKRRAGLDERIRKNPRDEAAYYERGQFFAQRGEAAAAVADFDQVLRINPGNPGALNNRCWTRAILNDLQKALADCNAALKLRPDFVDALDSRGFINLKTGAFRAAVADYDAALRIDATHSSALYGRGLARRGLGDLAQADRDFTEALQMNPSLDKEFAQYGFR